MKICLMNSFYEPPIKGGAEVYTQELAEELSKYHEVLFIATSPYSWRSGLTGRMEENRPIKVVSFSLLNLYHGYHNPQKPVWMRLLWNIVNTWNPHSYTVVRNILKREKPDIVHSHCLRVLSPSVVSAIDSLGIPHVHSLHNYELISPWGNLLRRDMLIEKPGALDMPYLRLMRFFTRNTRAVIGPIHFILDFHTKHGFFKKARTCVIPWGRKLSSGQDNDKDFSTIDLLFVGEISKIKGVHILLDAFATLNETNLRLHIVGQGPLAKQVSERTLRDERIRYHGYLAQRDSLMELYSKANLLVIPSMWFENLPSVAIEALSAGTPIVSSAIGGMSEVIEDGYNGFLFKPGDMDDLSRTFKRALSDVELLKKLGENAKQNAQKYNMDSHIESLLKVYEEALR